MKVEDLYQDLLALYIYVRFNSLDMIQRSPLLGVNTEYYTKSLHVYKLGT
jgi:hypothetical protein